VNVETTWTKTFQPLAEQYAALREDVETTCRALDDNTLNTLDRQAHEPTQTNCWWATWEVAKIVRHEVKIEKYRRQLRGEKVSEQDTE
jgi:hypothetical protein